MLIICADVRKNSWEGENMAEILTKKLSDHLYRFEEAGGPNQVHAYLLCGAEKALMIDGLWLADGLQTEADKVLKAEYGEGYTQENRNKMLTMLITHGHEDHAGKGMEEFLEAGCKVYVPERDWSLLAKMHGNRREQIAFITEEICGKFTDSGMLALGQEEGNMDLGGITAQIIKMPGHTPGSLLVLVPEWNALFTSDAIGAGVLWMQLPECSTLAAYQLEVKKLFVFLVKEKERTGKEMRICPGHAQQILSNAEEAGGNPYGQQDYLTCRYVREVLELTKKIMNNPQVGKIRKMDYPGLEHVRVRSTGERLLYDYCYDENCVR